MSAHFHATIRQVGCGEIEVIVRGDEETVYRRFYGADGYDEHNLRGMQRLLEDVGVEEIEVLR